MVVHERKSEPSEAQVDESGLPWFAQDEKEDRKLLRWAWVLAVALHAGLLVVQFPELAASEPPPPEKQKVYIVEQFRFKEPPPPETEPPRPRDRIVAIPDPTPDDPEPIRELEEIRPEIDLSRIDDIVEIPEGPPPPDPVGPVPVGGDVTAPVKIYYPQPGYTEMARRARIEGFVIVEAVVNKQGDVVDAKIRKSLPMGLDQEALDAIRRWKFEPATLNGKPVDVYFNVTVTFRLQ